ncbi:MAG: TIGR01777 family oxidoreductase [Candidatus Sumerlaeota bacterium]|nr:TIGR01777 family oxidoreductase [Candidatus Sumerlaeota bacterium]
MRPQTYVRRCQLPAPAEEAFRWHERPGALERLIPPWERMEVVERASSIRDGDRATLALRVGPLRWRWIAEHRDYAEGRQFRDVQIRGPFAQWGHTHSFSLLTDDSCTLQDSLEYRLPLGVLGQALAGRSVRRRIERTFAYRHRVLRGDLAMLGRYPGVPPMKILVSGSSGMIGSALVAMLGAAGHSVTRLLRPTSKAKGAGVHWDPVANEEPTRLLSAALAQLGRKPSVLVSASAVGYYGDRGEEPLDENSDPGNGFLPEVCQAWEAATEHASVSEIRVVHLRLGMVVTAAGGALTAMLPWFRLGLGGPIGSGRQIRSWIALDDALGAIYHCLRTPALRGPVNAVAPNPVADRDFARTLGRVLGRPAIAPVPAPVVRLMFGEMADEALLAGARVEPARLLATGYDFRYPLLEDALRHVLGR